VYRTPQDLVAAYSRTWPQDFPPLPLRLEPEKIYSCPLCCHDF
jgi:hypothetical protein